VKLTLDAKLAIDQSSGTRYVRLRIVEHLALAVADQERSRHFYESYFGFDPDE
jgi:catechol-2,3-dioxygenase